MSRANKTNSANKKGKAAKPAAAKAPRARAPKPPKETPAPPAAPIPPAPETIAPSSEMTTPVAETAAPAVATQPPVETVAAAPAPIVPPPRPRTKIVTVDELAPAFRHALERTLAVMRARGFSPALLRAFDPKASARTWDRYGLAADVGSTVTEEAEGQEFWMTLDEVAWNNGLATGRRIAGAMLELDPEGHSTSPGHVQWFCAGMPVVPDDHARSLLESDGVPIIWRHLQAIQ